MTLDVHRHKWLTAVLLLASAGWMALTASLPSGRDQTALLSPNAGFLAPDFTLTSLTGESYTLSDFQGQPVLVNLWASWCGPCRAEMPAMERIYQKYADDGFVILAVNTTHQDSVAAAQAFVDQHGLTFPILLDTDGQVSNLYGLRAMPSSFFIHANGIIEEVVIGGPMAEALLQTRIEKLMEDLR